MDTEHKGSWENHKGPLKQKITELADNDLLFAEGKKDEMMRRLQKKLGKTKEDIFKLLSDL